MLMFFLQLIYLLLLLLLLQQQQQQRWGRARDADAFRALGAFFLYTTFLDYTNVFFYS